MGSYVYEYLNDSLILDSSLFLNLYRGVSDRELEKELITYRECCLKALPDIRSELKATDGTVSCMATDTMVCIPKLKQAALYLEEAVVADPIFKLTDFRTSHTDTIMAFMGMSSIPKINRQELAKAAIKLIEFRPLVAGGYVKFYPVSFELERGGDIPILYSEVGFEDCLPSNILAYYKANAIVRSVQEDNGQLLVMKDLYPCRNISIRFEGMSNGFSMGYMLNPTEFKLTEKTNEFRIIQKKSTTPPEKNYFNTWVNQSINQTAKNHFIELNKRIFLCDSLGCMFGTEHPFESNLLNMNAFKSDIKSNTLNCMMQMEVPFLELVSSEDLMSIRNNDGEVFHSFRSELEKTLREVRHEADENRVRKIIEDAQHELFEVQMSQIAPQIKHINKTHLTEAVIAVAGLAFSVPTGGTSLAATAMALMHGYKSHSEYKSKITANPCHFLWNVKKKAKG